MERKLEHYDFFIRKNISLDNDEFVFLLPHKNIIFLKSGDKYITINVESIFFAKGEYKDFIFNLLKGKIVIIPDFKTMTLYLTKEAICSAISIENLLAIKNDLLNVFEFIHSEMKHERFFETLDLLVEKFNLSKNLSDNEKIYYDNLRIKDVATDILSNSFVYSNSNLGGLFHDKDNLFVRKLEYSNKRTVTGRIMCVDKFNIYTIAKNDLRRKSIISRFENGCLVNFDYTSFETTLSMFLTRDKKFIEKFIDKDLHEEIAKIIFNKEHINQDERKFGKNINHAVIFGAGKDTIINILNDFSNKEDVYKSITKFLSPILKKAKTFDEEYKTYGYIRNHFGTFIYPNKDYALYHNYVQSSAADIIARKIISVNNILLDYKSKIVTSIYDSIIIDLCPGEEFLVDIITNEMKIMGDFVFNLTNEKINNLFEK